MFIFEIMTLKFPRVNAHSSFERIIVEIGKISQLNLGKYISGNVNNYSQIYD